MAALTRLGAMAVAVSLFSCVAWAQTYPVLTYPISGVWVERADRFPGLTAGASLILKKLGEDAVLAQPLPNFDLRYEEIVLRKKTQICQERNGRQLSNHRVAGQTPVPFF
jgi:hypothetical protein